jgi:hypothetical protein
MGDRESALDPRQGTHEGKVLIAGLPKGRLGEDASPLLGHPCATLSLVHILPEARKDRLNLILAPQYLDQLDLRLQQALLGNVGTLIAFRVGVRDARALAEEFFPEIALADLVSLPRYHIYLRLMIDGVVSPGFSAVTLEPPQ